MVFSGDSATVRVDARYLFGLPMAGGSVQWSSSARERQPWELNIPGLTGFSVGHFRTGRAGESTTPVPYHGGTVVTGDDGTIRVRIPVDVMRRPGTVSVNVTAADVNRQTVTAETTIPVHSANAYISLRTQKRRWLWKHRATALPSKCCSCARMASPT